MMLRLTLIARGLLALWAKDSVQAHHWDSHARLFWVPFLARLHLHCNHPCPPPPQQVLRQQVSELEAQLAACRAQLAESEARLRSSTARVKELEEEVENHARVFELHYEALLDKDKTIKDLEAVVSALSLGADDGHPD